MLPSSQRKWVIERGVSVEPMFPELLGSAASVDTAERKDVLSALFLGIGLSLLFPPFGSFSLPFFPRQPDRRTLCLTLGWHRSMGE